MLKKLIIFKEEKIINVIYKTWFPEWQGIKSFTKKLRFLKISIFPVGMFFDENNVAKLVGDNEEEAIRRCSSKQVFLNISQFSQENTCVGDSF